MLPDNIPQCCHIRMNGVRCGSPALRGEDLCFFHKDYHEKLEQQEAQKVEQQPIPPLPPLEDAESIQWAIGDTVNALVAGKLDPRQAGLILYALQIASANLKKADFQPNWREVITRLT